MLSKHSSHHKIKTRIHPQERRLHFYERGDEITLMPQGIWQVNRGVIQLFKLNPQGEETLLGWIQEHSFFGLWFTSLGNFQAKALSDVYLQWFSLAEIECNPELQTQVLRQLVIRNRQSEELLAIAGLKKVEERLIQLLNLLSRHFGEQQDDSLRIKIRLTHQNLADAIASTRVTVTRILGDLQKQGLINIDESRHIILN